LSYKFEDNAVQGSIKMLWSMIKILKSL
jgi:hypothetical protein